jgi:hypothetical protein
MLAAEPIGESYGITAAGSARFRGEAGWAASASGAATAAKMYIGARRRGAAP